MVWSWSSGCAGEGWRGAGRRELRRLLPQFLGSFLLFEAAVLSMTRVRDGSWMRYALCVVAGLSIMSVVFIGGWTISRKLDEFERGLMVRSAVWAIGALLTVCTVWGFLAEFGGVRQMPSVFVAIGFFLVMGIANRVLRVRNRSRIA
jgi:hypothetical protein